jgi:hypothetical protein
MSNRKLLRTKELAGMWSVKHTTLEKARSTGTGAFATLPFLKIGRCVFYDEQTCESWLSWQEQGGGRKVRFSKH